MDNSAAYLEGAIRLIEVLPLEAAEPAPAQAGGQLRVEEVMPDVALLDGLHKGIQLFIC